MFSFFKRKGGKDAEQREPSAPVAARPTNEYDVTNEKLETTKDVVNLLIPETDYNQKTGVGAFLQLMAGKRKKGKKVARAESERVSPPKEMKSVQRSESERAPRDDAPTKNNDDAADFVKALVLQKYANANKTPEKQHVSLVYVSNPDLNEKQHAEALLREIARSIDCTIDKIIENKENAQTIDKIDEMGATDSKEPVYETVDDNNSNNSSIDSYKNELKRELQRSLAEANINENKSPIESPAFIKKSNLKPPKSDTEVCSDDDRSESSKKRVTFRKHIIFDDGDQQTDEEIDSSFESLTSEEEEDEYLEDALPDNDEFLGGFTVTTDSEHKTVINVENEGLKRISSDNSDSGFLDDGSEVKTLKVESESESEVSEVTDSGSEDEVEIIEIIEEVEEYKNDEVDVIEPDDEDDFDNQKTLVSQESKFNSQVAALTELADSRCGEAESARDLIAAYRKDIQAKDLEIEQLKCDLAAAYKESELVRQRSRSLEEDLAAARACSADLADKLKKQNDESVRQLRAELEDALTHRAELESRVEALERDRDSLERQKVVQEQRAQEALIAAEASTAKWRSAHEAARSQAAARAERMLDDCEWKMRELEQKARDAEKTKKELTATIEQLQSSPQLSATHVAELQQLRGVVSENQRSVHSLSLQLQKVETREEALKLEVHRLKELLDKQTRIAKEKEERHFKTIERLEQEHSKTVEQLKAEHAQSAASSRANLERAHAERTRSALAQLRAEAEQDSRNADRKLREITTRFENLKEELASKEAQYEKRISEANSKADWDIMQLRHLLDKADITYANNVEKMNERFEKETERLNAEWAEKLREIEEQASTAAEQAKNVLEETRSKLIAEKNDQVNKMKEQHRQEMDDQWEQFMTDKETCLTRMKAECRQEGEEDRVKREKELLEEIQELRGLLQSKSVDFDHLAVKAAACGRTLVVTEQELREALARERDLREKRAEDGTKIKQLERHAKDQVEHLERKCACLRKLFDDMRARLTSRERVAAEESRAKDKEIVHLKAEVARLTKLLMGDSSPKLGARTSADGCEEDESFKDALSEAPCPPRRKGSTRTRVNEARRRALPEMPPPLAPPAPPCTTIEFQNGRRRSKSVDLPAVQVPVRIKQFQLQESKDC